MELPKNLQEIFRTGVTYDLEGNKREVDSSVSEAEAKMLMKMVVDVKAKNTLETGVADGASAVAFCGALRKHSEGSVRHYGVDPNQYSFYGGSAIAALQKDKLDDVFELLEGPSHLMLPGLIEKNLVIDCAFIDGWHTFDYTLIDFFLIDKMLKPGGLIAFHDMYGRAKQKVLKYILTHRDYEIAKEYRIKNNESKILTIKFFIKRLLRHPALIFSWFHWTYQLNNSSGLLVIRKRNNFEPIFSFFKNF